MRVELPEGYVPPEPTHPRYGYLTPEELEAYETEERSRLGIVPEPPGPGSEETKTGPPPTPRWVPPAPPPDQSVAAGGRGASSSWTSADGQRSSWSAASSS